jgi:type VI secretion system protein ImpE
MLNSEQALKEGNLEQALAEIQQLVRKDPANAKHRIYLFQLFSVLGQWERALTQLNGCRYIGNGTNIPGNPVL